MQTYTCRYTDAREIKLYFWLRFTLVMQREASTDRFQQISVLYEITREHFNLN